MKLRLKSRRLWVLSFVISALMLASYFRGAKDVSGRLVGTWEESVPSDTVQTTFHWNGTYETVVNFGTSDDASNPLRDYVLRGRYSDNGTSIHLYDFKRYVRRDRIEQVFEPCQQKGCELESEVAAMDEYENKKGGFYEIKKANWKAGEILVTSSPSPQGKAYTETWTRQP